MRNCARSSLFLLEKAKEACKAERSSRAREVLRAQPLLSPKQDGAEQRRYARSLTRILLQWRRSMRRFPR